MVSQARIRIGTEQLLADPLAMSTHFSMPHRNAKPSRKMGTVALHIV